MHTLVTGGAGFIGSALVGRLLAEGHTVDVVDNLSSGSLWNLAEARSGAGRDLSVHQLDIRSSDVADLIARRTPEVVWHLAGHEDADGANANPAADAEVNVVGTLRLLEAVRAGGVRKLVVASSASVYGEGSGATTSASGGSSGAAGNAFGGSSGAARSAFGASSGAAGSAFGRSSGAASETTPRRPRSAHAIAKHTVDAYLAAFADIGSVVFTSLVLSNVYGPLATGGVVAAWAECLVSGRPCTVFGRGDQIRDFVFVDDVVDALARAATRGDGMILNIGTGTPTSLADLHATMIELAAELHVTEAADPEDDVVDPAARRRGPALGVRQAAPRAGDLHSSVLDPSRAARELEWTAWTSLRDGLAAVVNAAAHPRP